MMTVSAIVAGLLPIMWSQGTASEVMQSIAAPMIGGKLSSTLFTLMVISSIYAVVKGIAIRSRRLSRASPLALRICQQNTQAA
jgi:Cu(I)/Ag(I) efflux system membrane protein CusA/SilA